MNNDKESYEKRLNKLKKLTYLLLHKSLIRIKEYNKENLEGGSFIVGSNHTGDIDGPILSLAIENLRIMAKKECFEETTIKQKIDFFNVVKTLIPALGLGKLSDLLTSVNVVPVDRLAQPSIALKQAFKYLSDADKVHKSYLMFVQGTISDINKNDVTRIMPGIFMLSAELTHKLNYPVPIVPTFMEQPRFFMRSRIVYGERYVPDILDEKGKLDRDKLELAKLEYIEKILKLQQLAVELENRPIRPLKLDSKHKNNNHVESVKTRRLRKTINKEV